MADYQNEVLALQEYIAVEQTDIFVTGMLLATASSVACAGGAGVVAGVVVTVTVIVNR